MREGRAPCCAFSELCPLHLGTAALRQARARSVHRMLQLVTGAHASPFPSLLLSRAACYPFYDRDPFLLTETPHVYFAGNQPAFETRLLKGELGWCIAPSCLFSLRLGFKQMGEERLRLRSSPAEIPECFHCAGPEGQLTRIVAVPTFATTGTIVRARVSHKSAVLTIVLWRGI